MTNNTKQIVDEKNGVMIRIDKTLKDMMDEKPFSRLSTDYWHPKFEKTLMEMDKKFKIEKLGKDLTRCNQGDGLRTKKGDKYVSKGIPMISVIDIKFTGIDYSSLKQIVDSHFQRISKSQPKYGDILIVRSGAGSIGRSSLFLGKPINQKIGITGHINTLGFKKINSFYVEAYLKTIFGQQQIERYESGVSGQTELTQNCIAEIKIPLISDKVQKNIEKEYLKMNNFHEKAMEAKRENNETEYQNNIQIAEKMLNDLIEKTEQVIRGERKDVI
ncbi:MAG: hypothetical protein ABIJ33_00950 [Patescibacteria group bacterium]|nr:hypothetical protein [Patescibacteria group bacterium]